MYPAAEHKNEKLRNQILGNNHEIYVYSFEVMDEFVKLHAKGRQAIMKQWEAIKWGPESFANYAPLIGDGVVLGKLMKDLGGWNVKAYVNNYGGKPHISIQGSPALRKVFTDITYSISSPKVIKLGLGKYAAQSIARSGGILSVVLMTAYRVAEYVLTDEATLTRLIGNLAVDIVKVGITVAGSLAAIQVMAVFGIAIGPIAAVVAVGVLATLTLGPLFENFGIANKVIAGLDELAFKASIGSQVYKTYLEWQYISRSKQALAFIEDFIEDTGAKLDKVQQEALTVFHEAQETVFDYMVDSARRVAIKTANHVANDFLNSDGKLK